MVLISSKALLVPFCVHFKMLVVHRDASQMRDYVSLLQMQLGHTLFKEDSRQDS
ncbi:mCG146869 [Mus musculus]|nr:mCG146869 [Mus musculus]